MKFPFNNYAYFCKNCGKSLIVMDGIVMGTCECGKFEIDYCK